MEFTEEVNPFEYLLDKENGAGIQIDSRMSIKEQKMIIKENY